MLALVNVLFSRHYDLQIQWSSVLCTFYFIFQFVKFSDYCVSEQGGAAPTPTLFVQNQAKLAKAVLAEVPNQLTEFMKYRGFTPLNQ